MYCAKCEDLMIDDTPLQDEEGYDYAYDEQLCSKCRPKDKMTQKELDTVLKTKITTLFVAN